MIYLVILTFMFIIILSTILISFKNKKISSWIETNKSKIEVIYIVTALLTILSIFYGIWQFSYEQEQQRKIQKENELIIFENLIAEIHKNLEYIDYLEKNEKGYIESNNAVPNFRLRNYYLEKSRDLKIDLYIKDKIINAISLIEQSNNLLERYAVLYVTNNAEQQETLIQLKNKDIKTIIDNNKNIKEHLIFIENNLKI